MARSMLKIINWCARNATTESSNLPVMVVHFKQADKRIAANAFTLAETLIAIVVLVLVMSGLIYGYVQMNRTALFSSMSLAAQSTASQGVEQARCAKWDTQVWPPTNTGPGTGDELGVTNYTQSGSNYTLDIPVSGAPVYITNYVSITKIGSGTPPIRQIRSDCVWEFSPAESTNDNAHRIYITNTVITLRAPDQ
jgi:type II secretory pathway pseudopilin PulG